MTLYKLDKISNKSKIYLLAKTCPVLHVFNLIICGQKVHKRSKEALSNIFKHNAPVCTSLKLYKSNTQKLCKVPELAKKKSTIDSWRWHETCFQTVFATMGLSFYELFGKTSTYYVDILRRRILKIIYKLRRREIFYVDVKYSTST